MGTSGKLDAARDLERRGLLEAAEQAYREAGSAKDAARLARRLGRPGDAAALYAKAGLPFEAGTCFAEAGDGRAALDQLRRVSRETARYRDACVRAAPLVRELGAPSFEWEQFLAPFLDSEPRDEQELSAFYELGAMFEEHGQAYDARDAYRKVSTFRPGYRDIAVRLARLPGEPTQPEIRHDALPDLPELPRLPDPKQVRTRRLPTPPAQAGLLFEPGTLVAERYRIEERIGAGGMAVVFRVTDLDLSEEVALKVFTQVLHDEADLERFKRELKLSRQLSSPHVVRLYDIGTFRGVRYISMELLEGQDLRKRMAAPLANSEALDYLTQACLGLQTAHDAGVVHRDFKPENCFVTKSGAVKVMDFGIAKVQNAPGLTTTGIIAGTPAYISPEQISDFSSVSPASDQYSLGVVAYELFCGRLPFVHHEAMKLLMMHLNESPPPPRSLRPDLPQPIEDVVLKLMQREPGRRFTSCREVAGRLQELQEGLPG